MTTAGALAIGGAAAVGLYLLFRRSAAAVAPYPPPAAAPQDLASAAQNLLYRAVTDPNSVNRQIFGVDQSTFHDGKAFTSWSDFEALKDYMHLCYKGNQSACAAAFKVAPNLRTCKPGDCDDNPIDLGNGQFLYRDSHGGPYQGSYGSRWNAFSDFDFLAYMMSRCYRGDATACAAAKKQAPGLRTCKPGDCDEHPTNPRGNTVSYRDSQGGPYETTFQNKSVAVGLLG